MKYALKNGIILDGNKDMQAIKNKMIIVEDDKIVDIVDESKKVEDINIIDLKGQYIMPGLINLHVHLPATGEPKKKKSDPVKLVKLLTKTPLRMKIVDFICKRSAQMQLLSGCTTIRTVGGVKDVDSRLRDSINCGKTLGPRILASNMAISVPSGHMANSLAYACENIEEAIKDSEKVISEKPDLLKLMITGGVIDAKKKGEPGELKMQAEMVKKCCELAHKNNLMVAAHVESSQGVRVALENGVDTIEHGAKLDEELIKLFKKTGAVQVATLSPALPYALMDPSITGYSEDDRYNGNVVFTGVVDCAKNCLENNIKVGLGTDTGCDYVPQYGMFREVELFAKYVGVSNSFALYTATLNNAQIAHIDNITGSIEVGKSADMIVCKTNPIEDLKALSDLSMVIIKGEVINNPKYKKSKKIEEEMSKYC